MFSSEFQKVKLRVLKAKSCKTEAVIQKFSVKKVFLEIS